MKLTTEQKAALRHREAHDCSLIMLPNPEDWNSRNKTPQQKQEIIDRAQTLQAGLRLSYEQKCVHTEKVIKKALEQDVLWAVSFSGGKDSTVLSHFMVFGMGLKLPHVMSNTRMEYPETIKNVARWYERLRNAGVSCHSVFPKVRPKDLWLKFGVPLWGKQTGKKFSMFNRNDRDVISDSVADNLVDDFRKLKAAGLKITDQCCDELKKKPLALWDRDNRIGGHFTGVRCGESRARRLMWIQRGALYNSVGHRQWLCSPLVFWSEKDIYRYLSDNAITHERPSTLKGGSGCVTCMFGCHLQEENSLQHLARVNPRMHKVALDEWGYRPVLDLLNIPYE